MYILQSFIFFSLCLSSFIAWSPRNAYHLINCLCKIVLLFYLNFPHYIQSAYSLDSTTNWSPAYHLDSRSGYWTFGQPTNHHERPSSYLISILSCFVGIYKLIFNKTRECVKVNESKYLNWAMSSVIVWVAMNFKEFLRLINWTLLHLLAHIRCSSCTKVAAIMQRLNSFEFIIKSISIRRNCSFYYSLQRKCMFEIKSSFVEIK